VIKNKEKRTKEQIMSDTASSNGSPHPVMQGPDANETICGGKPNPTPPKVRLPKFSPEDIGAIIGPSKAACDKNVNLLKLPSLRKDVIAKSWSSYNLYKKAEKIEGDDPKTPYIRIDKDEAGVFAVITSDSEVMRKFALMHLEKYHDTFIKPKRKMIFTLYATLPHDMTPLLIGRGGSAIKAVKTDAVSQMEESVDPKDLAECEKSYLKVDKFVPRDFDDFAESVNQSDRADFVGWQPEHSEELVKVFVTSFSEKTAFANFIECLSGTLDNHIQDIIQKNQEFSKSREKELQDCYEALESED
jgi:hypothetical protein